MLLDAYCAATLPSILEEGPEPLAAQQGQQAQQEEEQQEQYHWQPPPPGSQQAQQEWHGQCADGRSGGHLGNGGASTAARLMQHAPQRLQSIPDDGYILINLGHHLTAAGRHQQVDACTCTCTCKCTCPAT